MQTSRKDTIILKKDTPILKWKIVFWWRKKSIRGDINLVIFGKMPVPVIPVYYVVQKVKMPQLKRMHQYAA